MSAAILAVLPKPRGRQPSDPRMALLRMFPNRTQGRSYIYAIGFAGGVVKVGQTTQPRDRLAAHWKTANGEVEWMHLFEPMSSQTARHVEWGAAKALGGLGKQIHKSEWFFSSADKVEIISVIRPLIAKSKAEVREMRARDSEQERERQAIRKLLKDHGFLTLAERA